jgi:hypothetical protein
MEETLEKLVNKVQDIIGSAYSIGRDALVPDSFAKGLHVAPFESNGIRLLKMSGLRGEQVKEEIKKPTLQYMKLYILRLKEQVEELEELLKNLESKI